MIRVRLLHEGKSVKQITSRVSESVVMERIQKFEGAYDEVVVVEGELSEGAKEILQRVAKKVIPAAMAAGIAVGGASGAQAQNALPGTDRSIGQHISDIFSPNYREIVRQRRAEQDTERRVWDAKQREIAKARISKAKEEGRREAEAMAGKDMPGNIKVYDQARKSADGKTYILYDLNHHVVRIPVKGTEFIEADSQRLAHYLTARGGVYYVRQPAKDHQQEGINEDPTVGTIPASGSTGGTSSSTIKPAGTRAPGGAPSQADKEEETDAQAIDLDKDHGLDKASIDAIKKAGVAVNIKEYKKDRLKNMLLNNVNEALGDRYADQLAHKVRDVRDDLDTSGDAAEFIDVAYDLAMHDLGRRQARYLFAYDEDFVSDLIGAYASITQSKGAVKEGFTDSKMQAILDQYHDSWQQFKAGGEIDSNPQFYDALFDYFMDSGEMPYEVAKARSEDPIEWITSKMDTLAGNEKIGEAEDDYLDQATAADQAAADKNIIMQIRKAADYEKPTTLDLDDGSRVQIDASMSKRILKMFDQLRPDSKAMMQQLLGQKKGFDELTKELSKVRENAVREAAEQYTSLNDAYPAGSTEIWYFKQENARDFMMGGDFLEQQGIKVTPKSVPETHVMIGKIAETNPEKIFSMMQGESWSPEGQARDMISKSGTGHTSMSVGDVIKTGNKWLMVDSYGFRDLDSGTNEGIDMSQAHIDARMTAALIADRIMNEVFKK